MEISEERLRELLEQAWDLASAAARAWVDEPALKEAEIAGLIDSAEEET